MKRFLAVVVITLLVFGIFFSMGATSANALSVLNITASPDTISTQASYTIHLQSGATYSAGDHLYVQFPTYFTVPVSINPSYVKIANTACTAVSVSGQTVNITFPYISPSIIVSTTFDVTFNYNAGIVNPASPGIYQIDVWTNKEIVQLGSVSIGMGGGGGSTVTGLTAYVSPADSGKAADYLLIFNVSNNGALVSSGDYVDVYFPAGTTLPSDPDASKVRMKTFQCTNVSVNGLRARVYVPASLGLVAPGAQCNIEFTEAFGIKNPEQPGSYNLQVVTSKDTGLVTSNTYTVVGTSITNLSVTVNPTAQNTVAEYRIIFNTSTSGTLSSGADEIDVIFPNEVMLPTSVIPGAITVNGTPCTNVEKKAGNKLVITAPVNVSLSTQVTVIISASFGIKNPEATGTYELSVYTSMDTSMVKENFTITTSQITQPTVQLSATSAGQVSSYTISFATSTSGALSGGIDKINVIFPVGTTVPLTIPISTVTVNNIPTTYVTVYGTTVTITVPLTIPANSSVTVILSEDVGIKNPVNGGPYFLYVNTTKEPSSVASVAYTIFIVPVTTVTVTPQAPDGLNGYYKTQPAVIFTASSAIDTSPFIYYYFDSNSPVLYGGQPITVPEGTHTLFYYAVDHQGHQEASKSMQFKVDTVPPQLIVSTPQDNAVLNSKDIAVSGTVDVGATIKVNGQAASVDSAGHFSATVHITGNSAVINITAVDSAGNSTQKTLHVSLDTIPPALTITAPVPFQEIHKLPVQITGKTEPGTTVTVDGNAATVDEDGNFTYALATLKEGEMSIIEVIAKDTAGNTTKKNINVKYMKTTIITLQIGNKNALINKEAVTLDALPVIKNGRTLVPLRFISEAFGAEIAWDPVFQIIDITLGNDIIRLQIGKDFSSVNWEKFAMDTAPIIDHGRTLVPIRFISETLDAQVLWDGATKTVTIMYPKP